MLTGSHERTGGRVRRVRLVAALAAALLLEVAASGPVMAKPVATRAGLVEGRREGNIEVFRGIPFAAAPVGPLRWKAPQPPVKWNGTRQAARFAPACPQIPFDGGGVFPVLPTSEDCLYLNVWTPADRPTTPLPVMVWIYGGSFTAGGTGMPSYSGEALAAKGVIVVSVAYRVGALGFLAHPQLSEESKAHASGNYGLLDLVAGLQWVHDNIANFGGNPNRVTIFGESAGATAVGMLAGSPKTKGLIQGAISESGGAFSPARSAMEGGQTTPLLATAEARGIAFLKKLGVPSIAAARKLPVEKIVQAAGSIPTIFWPVQDGDVLPGDFFRRYLSRKYNDIPVLAGINSDEGALFVPKTTVADYRKSLTDYGQFSDEILSAYPARSDDEALQSARALFSDTIFGWPTWSWARLQTDTGGSNVYLYYFDRVAAGSPFPIYKPKGALHGSEIDYVFGHPRPGWTDEDRSLSEQMTNYWVNFARNGDPNGPGLPAWPAFSPDSGPVLHLDANITTTQVPNLDRLRVLDGYYSWRRAKITH